MSFKKILPFLLAAMLVVRPDICGAEVWRDRNYDIMSLRKVFLLPIDANLKAGGQSSLMPESQRSAEIEGWAVADVQAALKKNHPIVKPLGALIKDMEFIGYKDAAADVASNNTEALERFFAKAAELGYQAAVYVSLAQKFDTVHVPESTWTHTVYKEIERRDKHGKIIEVLRVPEEKTEVTPAHDDTYLSTECLIKIYDTASPRDEHKAAVSRSIHKEYQGGPVMKVIENILKASFTELFEQKKKK